MAHALSPVTPYERSRHCMARKPNYDFEKRRKELDRKAKKDAKRADRQQRRDERRPDDSITPLPAPEDGQPDAPLSAD